MKCLKLFITVKSVACGAAMTADRSTRTWRGSRYAAAIATISSRPTHSMIRLTQFMATLHGGHPDRRSPSTHAQEKGDTFHLQAFAREMGQKRKVPPLFFSSCTGGRL